MIEYTLTGNNGDLLRGLIDKTIREIKRWYIPELYDMEVEYNRRYWDDFLRRHNGQTDMSGSRISYTELIAYFDRRVLEILGGEPHA